MPFEPKVAGDANSADRCLSDGLWEENLRLRMELCKANIFANQLLLDKLEREAKERESGPHHR